MFLSILNLKMFLIVLLSIVPVSLTYDCTKVNGVEGACDLKLNQLTLAGSRLSGCGAYGKMYYWSGGAAMDCYYATQDRRITEQLEMGIRSFHFDVSYIHASEESLPWWEEGPVLVSIGSSAVAYSRSLRLALTEIRDFLQSNRDEVLTMRISQYYPRTREIRDHLIRSIKPLFDSVFGAEGSEGVQMTFYTTLRPLRHMIESNERMALYLHKDLWGHTLSDYRAHPLVQFESSREEYGYYHCHNPHQLAEQVLKIEGINKRNIPLVVNWWLKTSSCVSEMAGVCMKEVGSVETLWDEVLRGTHLHRPVNVVAADYVRPPLVHLVNKLNKKAVQFYKENPW